MKQNNSFLSIPFMNYSGLGFQFSKSFNKVYFLLLILLLITRVSNVNSQSTVDDSNDEEQEISPFLYIPNTLSPNAAAFQVYSITPVNPNTGLPQISIPIWTINDGDITMPISLSYHASGIKIEDIASWAGLGWTLNAWVTRSVVGQSDEFSQVYFWENKTDVLPAWSNKSWTIITPGGINYIFDSKDSGNTHNNTTAALYLKNYSKSF